MTKLGFLGAMNRDVVVRRAAASLLRTLGADAPPLVETPVSDAVAARGADLLEGLGAANYLGGSAFNTARVVALLDHEHRHDLAFFGIAGTIAGQSPHLSALAEWGVSTADVSRSDLPPATCLAMVEPAGRTLLTAHGANAGIADWLQSNARALSEALAARDLVHVTSFLDLTTPGLIAAILEQARALNPGLLVSLDPGMAWISPGGQGLAKLLRQTSILHLNAEELIMLGGRSAVASIGARLAPQWTIVARGHDSVALYAKTPEGIAAEQLPNTPFYEDIKDATGAGDTFCGGFLWSYARNPADRLGAARLGFALARQKVQRDGPLTGADVQRATSGLREW